MSFSVCYIGTTKFNPDGSLQDTHKRQRDDVCSFTFREKYGKERPVSNYSRGRNAFPLLGRYRRPDSDVPCFSLSRGCRGTCEWVPYCFCPPQCVFFCQVLRISANRRTACISYPLVHGFCSQFFCVCFHMTYLFSVCVLRYCW